ncbi:MAG: GBS Bsp-like repeat-containing protein [Coriobacteriia bacterium]|nr:GBS Bsp-like repeat-containing protein [Coriobacteriia bacterium]
MRAFNVSERHITKKTLFLALVVCALTVTMGGYASGNTLGSDLSSGASETPHMLLLEESSVALTVTRPTGRIATSHYNVAAGTFRVTVSNINALAGISQVRVPVWHDSNGRQNNLIWYTATRQSNGDYTVNVAASNHGWRTGTYVAHAYVRDSNGAETLLGGTRQTVQRPPVEVRTAVSSNQRQVSFYVAGGQTVNATAVWFPTWSNRNGQDDLVWHRATRMADGSWQATVPLSLHRDAGAYTMHVHADIPGSGRVIVGSKTFTVTPPTGRVSTSHYNTAAGTFRVTVGNLRVPQGISEVQIAVWRDNNGRQDQLRWFRATRQANGDYTLNVAASNHAWLTGTYIAHAYVRDANEHFTIVGSARQSVVRPPVEVRTAVSNNQRQVSFYVAGGQTFSATAVWFPTWSNRNGQDDLVWHRATRMADGSWQATVPLSLHRDVGAYTTHVYADIPGSGRIIVGSKAFTIATPTGRPTVRSVDTNAGTMVVEMTVASPAGVQAVQFPFWSNANQSDIQWVTATHVGNNVYRATLTTPHKFDRNSRTYQIHGYVRTGNGHLVLTGSTSRTFAYTGALISSNAELNREIQRILAITGNDLHAAYMYVVNNFSWQQRGLYPAPGWETPYALNMIRDGAGNCYSYAALFYYLARALGHNAQAVSGEVRLANGGWGPHSWVNITSGGVVYICDPEAQRSMRGYNFYMQPPGGHVLSYRW